jgi:peptide/nickel transport system ATP-binding protein
MGALLEVRDLKKYFTTPRGLLHAVDSVSFTLEAGKTLGVVGESGCGKSTLGRTIIHLLESTGGSIFFEGRDITHPGQKELKAIRRQMQMIFQDPFASLNPRMTVEEIIAEPLLIYHVFASRQEAFQRVEKLMDTVGIARRIAKCYPHELDGGRRQRVGVARALALEPKLIVCDEPVSALDVSVQAQILNLMQDLQDEFHLAYIFITHDMSVVKHISDHILVMYMGCMAEFADSRQLFEKQYHPYTRALLAAVPVPTLHERRQRHQLKGEISSPIDPKPGCRFATRCPHRQAGCTGHDCPMLELSSGHFAYTEILRRNDSPFNEDLFMRSENFRRGIRLLRNP